jgi:hypothetical protein
VIIHQGIIDPNDSMFPEGVIVSFFRPCIVPIPTTLEDVVEHIRAGRDDHVNQFHLDHVVDHIAHPAGNHRTGQPEEDDARGITEHLSEHFKTFKHVPTLKRGMLKGLNKIQKGVRLLEIQMTNGIPEEG